MTCRMLLQSAVYKYQLQITLPQCHIQGNFSRFWALFQQLLQHERSPTDIVLKSEFVPSGFWFEAVGATVTELTDVKVALVQYGTFHIKLQPGMNFQRSSTNLSIRSFFQEMDNLDCTSTNIAT